ncbi:putative small secreted protein [Golovinomyces cichoracearum]|uniref:Putative small secreted protein n=1 Tax=Golovinomyces cichoracearum TaxID=62708 RepID=A0A420HA39_9PEZI|nr:putative small secreted protein [Golovinomyces cichoracearum]
MKLISTLTALTLFMSVVSSPLAQDPKTGPNLNRRSVLSSQKYKDLQISDGVAGNAEQEAATRFEGIDLNNLASVSDEDVKLIKGIHDVAENAELKAFDPAIAKASGPELDALKIGKIKNKVLKTSATVLQLQIRMEKGEKIDPEDFKIQKKKKDVNIALDKKASGKESKGVDFNGSN